MLTKSLTQYLDYLIDHSFQVENILFALTLEGCVHRKRDTGYFLRTVKTKYYNFMLDTRNVFDQPVRNFTRAHNNIRNIITDQVEDYKAGCLLDYTNFK